MKGFQLPPREGNERGVILSDAKQVTLIGVNGAGKSRFMEELVTLAGTRAYCLSPLTDAFPGQFVVSLPDFMKRLEADVHTSLFDRLKTVWESLFPGNSIENSDEGIRFRTTAGNDLIEADRLSRGEKTALYYLAAVLYAPRHSVVFVDSPSMFLHPSVVNQFWNTVEQIRRDCRFVYDTVDAGFIGSRSENVIVWIRSYNSIDRTWDYDVLPASSISEELFVDLIGSRRPVLFIEGDSIHSIDFKLYTLVFQEYAVRPLGSCDKVIEATRSFTTLRQYHPLDTHGLVDRDRRTDAEVGYLRKRNIMVPEVAEVENIFLSKGVMRLMAEVMGKDPEKVVSKVTETVMRLFGATYEAQALQHTRHRMKRDVERKIDARFTCITALEIHINGLINKLRPRDYYTSLLQAFEKMLIEKDYNGILKVFNHKPMLTDSNVSRLLGFSNADNYIAGVLEVLRGRNEVAERLREEIRSLFTPVADDEVNELFGNGKRVFRHQPAMKSPTEPHIRKPKKSCRRSKRKRHSRMV